MPQNPPLRAPHTCPELTRTPTPRTSCESALSPLRRRRMKRSPSPKPPRWRARWRAWTPTPDERTVKFYGRGRLRGNRRSPLSTVGFGNFSRCFNKVTPGRALAPFAVLAGSQKQSVGPTLAATPLVAQPHWKVQRAALVDESGAVKARRPEGGGGIVREAVALLGLAEEACLHLRLVVLAWKTATA
jgi:hypothetical protein